MNLFTQCHSAKFMTEKEVEIRVLLPNILITGLSLLGGEIAHVELTFLGIDFRSLNTEQSIFLKGQI